MKAGFKRRIQMAIAPNKAMATWSRVIATYEALPEVYHPIIHQLQSETGEMPYIVLTPSDNFARKTAEQLLCLANETIYFLECHERKLMVEAFPIDRIRDVEVGAVLLYSWITIYGRDTTGQSTSKTIAYNSVSYPHFLPFIDMIRKSPDGDEVVASALEAEKNKFLYLVSATFKFMNYGRKSLKGDEQVRQILWEPEIREQVFSRLGLPFYRTLAFAHLIILTDQELIVLREDELSPLVKGNRYGGIWRYIPHGSLRAAAVSERSNGLVDLKIELEGNDEIPLLFRAENRAQAEELASRIEDAIRDAVGNVAVAH